LLFNLISLIKTAVKIKSRTKTFIQIGKKIVGGKENNNHVIFIPPIIENGNRNSIPVIIKLSLSSDI